MSSAPASSRTAPAIASERDLAHRQVEVAQAVEEQPGEQLPGDDEGHGGGGAELGREHQRARDEDGAEAAADDEHPQRRHAPGDGDALRLRHHQRDRDEHHRAGNEGRRRRGDGHPEAARQLRVDRPLQRDQHAGEDADQRPDEAHRRATSQLPAASRVARTLPRCRPPTAPASRGSWSSRRSAPPWETGACPTACARRCRRENSVTPSSSTSAASRNAPGCSARVATAMIATAAAACMMRKYAGGVSAERSLPCAPAAASATPAAPASPA